jgi:hypothetical protein
MENPMLTPAADHPTRNLLAQNLHDANSRLCYWLDRLAAGSAMSGSTTLDNLPADNPVGGQAQASFSVCPPVPGIRPPAPEQMTGLLSELTRAGAWLRQLPRGNDLKTDPENDLKTDPDLERELTHYRKNVERIRAMLPTIHHALLEERARLERERARVTSAAEWARVSRQTL